MQIKHEALEIAETKMDKTLNVLRKELVSIRAGRANAQLLDGILVDYYGTPTPIAQVGNIASPEPRLLTISLWDASMLREVEKAIQASDLGINPADDGKVIRLAFPEVTGEKRQELVKLAKKKAEDTKIALRAIRRDANEVFKKDKKASIVTEDDYDVLEKEIQTLTDKKTKEAEAILAAKEKEIIEV
ncbi:MAG: ribosome recycling factor [Christensenella sp.]